MKKSKVNNQKINQTINVITRTLNNKFEDNKCFSALVFLVLILKTFQKSIFGSNQTILQVEATIVARINQSGIFSILIFSFSFHLFKKYKIKSLKKVINHNIKSSKILLKVILKIIHSKGGPTVICHIIHKSKSHKITYILCSFLEKKLSDFSKKLFHLKINFVIIVFKNKLIF